MKDTNHNNNHDSHSQTGRRIRVAIIGTQGVPAQYGGFETLVENLIGEHCSADIDYTVICSSADLPGRMERYKNARLKYIGVPANGAKSLLYDAISLWMVRKGFDVILYLGAAVPVLKSYKRMAKTPMIINIDGLSQLRDKYGKWQKKYLAYIKNNEILRADLIVADNEGIREYVSDNYGLPSELIAYGGDQALMEMSPADERAILEAYGVEPGEYGIAVCRIEPENNPEMVLEAYARSGRKLVYIGNWEKSEYGRELRRRYSGYTNLNLHDPEYDLKTLSALRGNAGMYIHGHSVGGTNPSLVEAMFFGRPIAAFDVNYNRYTTFGSASYFTDADSLRKLISQPADAAQGEALKRLAYEHYTWRHIVDLYEQAYHRMVGAPKAKGGKR